MEEGNSQFTNLLTGEEIAKILHVSRAYARFPFCPNIAIGRHKPPYVPSDYLETPIYSTLAGICERPRRGSNAQPTDSKSGTLSN